MKYTKKKVNFIHPCPHPHDLKIKESGRSLNSFKRFLERKCEISNPQP